MKKLRIYCKKVIKVVTFILLCKLFSRAETGVADIGPDVKASDERDTIFITEKSRASRHKQVTKNAIKTARVALVKGNDLYSLTKEAIDMVGGMKKIVSPHDTVFIKPNYLSGGLDGHDPVTSGEITHPAVVASVAEECLRAGAKEVIIGEWAERPLKINFGGKIGKEGAQIKTLVESLNKKYGHKVYLINLMDRTQYFTFVPSQTKLRFLAIPNIVAEADVIISIPSLKTHHFPSPVSFGMKNFMGIMPSVLYGEPRYKLHEAGVHQVIVDINRAIQPDLVVIDGSFGMENKGASLLLGGETVDLYQRIGGFLVIAGTDPVATDATATRLITKNWNPIPMEYDLGTPWYVHHLRMAYEQGLGVLSSSNIHIVGEKLQNVQMSWKPSDDGVYPEIPKSDEAN